MATIKTNTLRLNNTDYEFIPPLPTDTERGGFLASEKDSSYTSEVKIGDDGKLYTKNVANGIKLIEWITESNTVVYIVDTDTSKKYTETVNNGKTCLSPTTFIPTKDGYDFVGWRDDTTADKSTLDNKTMGNDPVVLYAVFKKTITHTFKSYDDKSLDVSGTIYYNHGNSTTDLIKVPTGENLSGWNWRGWSGAGVTTANASVSYTDTDSIIVTDSSPNNTFYGLYSAIVTVSYAGNGNSSGSTTPSTGTKYYNGYGSTLDALIKLNSNGFAKSGYSFTKWAMGSTSGTQYDAGATVDLSEDTTFYALWTGVPYTWVDNYVGSGAGLSISITRADNCNSLNTGDTLTTFKVHSDHKDSNQNMGIDFRTNQVNTRGLTYMTIFFDHLFTSRGDDGSGIKRDYVNIKSSDGTVLHTFYPEIYQRSQKVNVSNASTVYIESSIGAWSQSASFACNIKTISFGNS